MTTFILLILIFIFSVYVNFVLFNPQKDFFKGDKYRLGDMIKYKNHRYNKDLGFNYHKNKFPNSIATEYMLTTNNMSDYPVLLKIISKRNYPRQYNNYLVIHLRLGDVIENSTNSVDDFLLKPVYLTHPNGNSVNYVKPLEYYQQIINKSKTLGVSKAILITGFHQGTNHTKSLQYVSHVKNLFQSKGFQCQTRINLDPDEDFLIMCNAKYFVPSGGGFSDVITNIVKLKGGRVISSSYPTQMLPKSTSLNQRRLLSSSKPNLSPGTATVGKSFITNNKEKKNDINQSDSYKFVDFWIHK